MSNFHVNPIAASNVLNHLKKADVRFHTDPQKLKSIFSDNSMDVAVNLVLDALVYIFEVAERCECSNESVALLLVALLKSFNIDTTFAHSTVRDIVDRAQTLASVKANAIQNCIDARESARINVEHGRTNFEKRRMEFLKHKAHMEQLHRQFKSS